jgi:hypothetical protein
VHKPWVTPEAEGHFRSGHLSTVSCEAVTLVSPGNVLGCSLANLFCVLNRGCQNFSAKAQSLNSKLLWVPYSVSPFLNSAVPWQQSVENP